MYTPEYNYDSYYDSGAYGSESHDSTATNPSTVSASAPQGAETTDTATSVNGSHSAIAAHTVPALEHDQAAPVPKPAPEKESVKAD